MPSSYHIEKAKSGRAKCKKCKEAISKESLRIGTTSERDSGGETISMTSWHHLDCFKLPRNLKKEGATAESFVAEDLGDPDGLLEEHKDEVIDAVGAEPAPSAKKKPQKKKTSKVKTEDTSTTIGKIKRSFQELEDADEEDRETKRAKMDDAEQKQVDLYKEYKSKNLEELKDFMRWNRQVIGGKKDILIMRCIDGELHGRLGRCPMCKQGKLKIEEDHDDVARCAGYFDEDMNVRISCSFKVALPKAPRLQPWYTETPTEEQDQEMDEIDERAKSGKSAPKNEEAVKDLLEKAKSVEWKVGNKNEIMATTAAMLEIAENGGVELPDGGEKKAVGKLVVANKASTPEDVMQLIIEEYGFSQDNNEDDKAAEDAAAELCANSANAKFYMMLNEFSVLIRKSSDGIKASAYTKAAQAVAGLTFEITEDNALSLGKSGKKKVPGIGKSTAEKLREFAETGTVEALENLRASLEG